MNKIFKVVLNKATGRLVVVSELVKSVGKSNSVTDKRSSVAGAVLNMVIIGGVGLFGTQALADVKESIDDSKNNVVYGANLDVNTTTTTTNQNLTVFGSKSTVVGSDSVVFGSNHNISGGSNNIAIGRSITAQAGGGAKVTLFGQDINYTGNTVSVTDGTFYSNPGFAVAVGNGLKARYNTVIVGNDNETTATLTTTLGILAKTNNDRGIAVGYGPEVKKALDGIAIGTKAVVDGNMSMAIGKDAKALQIQATALGPETKANGLSAVALGMRAQADGRSSSALGPWAEAHGKFAAAFGTQAFAVAENSTAIGQNAKANALNSTALGSLAVTTQDAEQSLAVGYNTNVSGKQSLAVGIGNIVSANYAGAIGDPSVVKGEGSYTLGNDNAIGSTAKNVGSFGNNNQIAITVPYTPEGKLDISNPSALLDIADPVVDSRVVGNRNYVNTSNTYVLGSGVGVKDDGTVLGTVKNSVYLGDDSTVATGAAVGTKNLDKEGVEGVTTTAGNEGTVDEATINGVTYGGFAGNKATGAVTVGAAGSERRLMNVAAGEISASSTDAINGSQLFIVARTLMDQYPVIYTDTEGNKVYKQPDGSFVKSDGSVVDPVNVIASMNDGDDTADTPKTLSNVASNLPSTYNTDVYNTGGVAVTKEQTLPVDAQGAALNVNNAATVGDILNAGWNLQGNGVAQDFVKPYDTVDFVDGAGTLAVIETAKDGASNTIRYDLNVDNSTIIINDEGKLVANYADAVKAATTKVEAGDNIVVTPVTNTDGSTTYTVATKKDVEFESVTVGPVVINQDGVNAGGTKITNVAPGDISADSQDAVNGSQLFKELETINGNIASSKEEVQSTDNSVLVTTTQNEAGANVYDLSVNTDGKTITKDANGSLTVNTTSLTNKADGSINTPASPDAIATAGDVANAINNAGFSLSAQGANASLVKPGSAVDMNNTDGNISISKSTSGNKVTYNLSKDIKVDSVSAGDTLVNNDGITIINGNTDGQAVSITKNGLNNGGNRITNVAPGIDGTDAVNVSQLKQLGGDINNQINKVDSDARAGVAQAMATAGLPQAYLPGKSMMAFASGRYRGEMGYAVGYSTISDGGNWVLKASASGNSRGSTGVTLGVGYQW